MRKKSVRRLLYLLFTVALLIWSVPRLPLGGVWTAADTFSVVWAGFCLLVIAALLYRLLGVNEDTERELVRLKRYRRQRMFEMIARAKLRRSGGG